MRGEGQVCDLCGRLNEAHPLRTPSPPKLTGNILNSILSIPPKRLVNVGRALDAGRVFDRSTQALAVPSTVATKTNQIGANPRTIIIIAPGFILLCAVLVLRVVRKL